MSALNKRGTTANNGLGYSGNGNLQEKKSPEQELYEIAVSTLYGKEQNYYESQNATLARLTSAVNAVVKKGNLDFIANTIIHARSNMNIRTMPIVLTGVFAKALRDQNKQYPQLRQLVRDVIQRADQLNDMIAVAKMFFGAPKSKKEPNRLGVQKMPMAFKRGIADAFNKFNEYGFAKYNRSGETKLRDALQIVHPTPKDELQGTIFDKIMKDTLSTPYTWETRLSENGQKSGSEKLSDKAIWTELVKSGDVGYMALLRNLRNILQAGLDNEVLKTFVCDVIANKDNVLKSKQFPFAYLNAYDAVAAHNSNLVNNAIVDALDHSFANLPEIGKNIWLIMDVSGSMTSFYGSYGAAPTQAPIKSACLFTAAVAKANRNANNLKLTMFSDRAEMVSINTRDSVMTIAKNLEAKSYGGGTQLDKALAMKSQLGFEPDTVVVMSDMEVNQLRGSNIKTMFGDDVVKIALNLNSRDTTPIGEKDGWYQLAGWSEKLFDFIPAMRNGITVVQALSVPYLGMSVKKMFK